MMNLSRDSFLPSFKIRIQLINLMQDSFKIRIQLINLMQDTLEMEATYSFKLRTTKCYRIPIELRAIKDEAYTPRMVSIGPLHRDKPELQNMEKEKRRYMSCFFDRVVEPDKEKFQINDESCENSGQLLARTKCTKVISDLEQETRAWYAEDVKLDKHQLVEMLVLDGCFILELLYKCKLISIQENKYQSLPIDPLSGNLLMVRILRNDLMLLENQIPFVVLQKLFQLLPSSKNASIGIPEMSLEEYIFWFFNSVPMLQYNILNFKDGPCRHLLDMLYHACNHTSKKLSSTISYVKIMSTLIRSPEDAYLLEQLGIVTKPDVEMDASAFFESLCRGVVFVDFCFTDLCKEVNDYQIPVWRWRRLKGYCRIKYIDRKASIKDLMKRDHFQNRWRPMKFLATSVLILLTLLQTFYTILAYYH